MDHILTELEFKKIQNFVIENAGKLLSKYILAYSDAIYNEENMSLGISQGF